MLQIIGWLILLPAAVCGTAGYYLGFTKAASGLELHRIRKINERTQKGR